MRCEIRSGACDRNCRRAISRSNRDVHAARRRSQRALQRRRLVRRASHESGARRERRVASVWHCDFRTRCHTFPCRPTCKNSRSINSTLDAHVASPLKICSGFQRLPICPPQRTPAIDAAYCDPAPNIVHTDVCGHYSNSASLPVTGSMQSTPTRLEAAMALPNSRDTKMSLR
jgi:hypothetical protein